MKQSRQSSRRLVGRLRPGLDRGSRVHLLLAPSALQHHGPVRGEARGDAGCRAVLQVSDNNLLPGVNTHMQW